MTSIIEINHIEYPRVSYFNINYWWRGCLAIAQQDMVISKIGFQAAQSGTATSLAAIIFDPTTQAILARSTATSLGTTAWTWYDVALTTPLTMYAGQSYFIGLSMQGVAPAVVGSTYNGGVGHIHTSSTGLSIAWQGSWTNNQNGESFPTRNDTPQEIISRLTVSIAGTTELGPTSTGRSGTIQTWTCPLAGDYLIDATGASGGTSYAGTNKGGHGARMKGVFSFTTGEVVKILVGQQGAIGNSGWAAGGGGGTYVWRNTTSELLIVAGGGGGAGDQTPSLSYDKVDASIDTGGYPGQPGSSGSYVAGNGGINGLGGFGGYVSGGGAGWTGNGGNSIASNYPMGGFCLLGQGANSGLGGAYSNFIIGGYGGGGAGYQGGGGGGGYSGGGGGAYTPPGYGGGGGSYNIGTMQNNAVGTIDGDGLVIVSTIPEAPTGITTNSPQVLGSPFVVSWTYDDPMGSGQAKYEIRWRKADS